MCTLKCSSIKAVRLNCLVSDFEYINHHFLSVAQHGVDSLDNFTGAINLMSNLLFDSCKQLDELWQEMHLLNKNNKTSKGGDAA